MRIGLIFDLSLPRPWGPEGDRELLANTLDLIALADELGIGTAWIQEHHLLEEQGHGGGAVAVLGAAAQRTSSMRLGLSLLSVDPAVRHPVVLAAEVATLDVLGGGRLDLATGVAATGVEVAGLGLERQGARAVWEARTAQLARTLEDGAVVPRPFQRPHPPLWLRADRPADIGVAARHGLGALCRAVLEPSEAGEWVAEYRSVLGSTRSAALGGSVTPRVAVCVPMTVHEDEATAIAQGLDAAHFQAFAGAHYERYGEHEGGVTDVAAQFSRRREDVGFSAAAVVADGGPLAMRVLRDGRASLRGAIGTPDQVVAFLGRFAEAGVDDLLLQLPVGAGDAEAVRASLRLFAGAVAPRIPAVEPPDLADAVRGAVSRRAPLAPAAPVARPVVAREEPRPAPVVTPSGGPPEAPARQVGVQQRVATILRDAVRRADDRRLERTLGSESGLRLIFAGMRRRYVPGAAGDFAGAITYELTDGAGTTRTWSVQVTPATATVVRGPVPEPALTVLMGVADFIRLATGELDPGHLLLTGRMDLRGDFALATQLGPMFGR